MSQIIHRHWLLSFVLLIGLAISACSSITKAEQISNTDQVVLSSENKIGQTFLSRYDGLNGIDIYLNPDPFNEGKLTLILYPNAQNTIKELARVSIPLSEIISPGFYHIPVPSLRNSTNKDYYLQLELEGQSKINLGKTVGYVYLNGSLYQNSVPQDAQLSFRLSYNPTDYYIGLFLEGLKWLAYLIIGFWLYIIPGWAVLSLALPKWPSLRWPEKLGLSAGVSLALYPVLLLWTDLFGLHLGLLFAWLPSIAGLFVIVWRNRKKFTSLGATRSRHKLTSNYWNLWATYLKSPSAWLPDILLIIILVLIFATRFWAIRNLDAPMWGDSYQHTMIAQLLADNGGLFESWEPYTDLTTFTYHFGFHSLVAAFHWVTGISMPQAVLWTGQIINGLAVLSIYPLALRVGRTRWAGVAAIFLAGLLSPMPMFYINWGRYTQLDGLVILVVAVFLVWEMLEEKRWGLGLILSSGIMMAGLALSHYRVLIIGSLFFPAFILLFVHKLGWRNLVLKCLATGIVAGIVFLPWFLHVFAGNIIQIFSNLVTTSANSNTSTTQLADSIGNITNYLPAIFWFLLPFAIGWGLWLREKGIALISFWSLLVLLATNPQWLGLPGAGVITNFTVFIAAYLPVSIILGASLGWIMDRLLSSVINKSENGKYPAYMLLYILVTLTFIPYLGIQASRQRQEDVQPVKHALLTRPDLNASEWIKDNLTQDAVFLVNTFFAFNEKILVGSDGGWWLPLIADVKTNLPPINYIFEKEPWPGYREWVKVLPDKIQAKGVDHPDVLEGLHERGITHVYIGQQSGHVNYDGPYVLDPDNLLVSPHYQPIYHQDRVWIFSIRD